ncbi:protein split ends-like isoform X2 [Atheta coriaria]|uniref:protein split ends-like isoform X2 n=1 Tax=Dalotia coriaria TaxID=877792 RepID=UPI0031F40B91
METSMSTTAEDVNPPLSSESTQIELPQRLDQIPLPPGQRPTELHQTSSMRVRRHIRQQPYHLQRHLEQPGSASTPIQSQTYGIRSAVTTTWTNRYYLPRQQLRGLQPPIFRNTVPHQLNGYSNPPPAHRASSQSQTTLAAQLWGAPLISNAPYANSPGAGNTGASPDRHLGIHPSLAPHLQYPLLNYPPDRLMSASMLEGTNNVNFYWQCRTAIQNGEHSRQIAGQPEVQLAIGSTSESSASHVPRLADNLLMSMKEHPMMWQGHLTMKNEPAEVQIYFVSGNEEVAKRSLLKNEDGSTTPLKIINRMRLDAVQSEGLHDKMQIASDHCVLVALPYGSDYLDVLRQASTLTNSFVNYFKEKHAAGILKVPAPGTTQPPAYFVHFLPSCDFVNENLTRIAPNLLRRLTDIPYLLVVIVTV